MSKLVFELSKPGRRCVFIPENTTPTVEFDEYFKKQDNVLAPEVAEIDLVRHYIGLSKMAHGVDNGFYPLGSCTMKYNPRINEDAAALSGFANIHPLQPQHTVMGSLKAMMHLQESLCEVTGMDGFTLQPAAGA